MTARPGSRCTPSDRAIVALDVMLNDDVDQVPVVDGRPNVVGAVHPRRSVSKARGAQPSVSTSGRHPRRRDLTSARGRRPPGIDRRNARRTAHARRGDDRRRRDRRRAANHGRRAERVLCPGFIDLQVNGHDDVHVSTADGADWDRMDALLVAQGRHRRGAPRWSPRRSTRSPTRSSASPRPRHDPRRPTRPAILGAHLEGPFLGDAHGAHNPDWVADLDMAWLDALPDIVRVMTLGPEHDGAPQAISALVDARRPRQPRPLERDVRTDDRRRRRGRATRHPPVQRNGRRCTTATPGILGAALADDRLVPSLIADGVHVHPAALRAAARAKGRGGWILVTDAVGLARRDRGRTAWRSSTARPGSPNGTIAGSCLRWTRRSRRMVHEASIDLVDVVRGGRDDAGAPAGRRPRTRRDRRRHTRRSRRARPGDAARVDETLDRCVVKLAACADPEAPLAFRRLALVQALHAVGDAMVAVALANTLFFNVPDRRGARQGRPVPAADDDAVRGVVAAGRARGSIGAEARTGSASLVSAAAAACWRCCWRRAPTAARLYPAGVRPARDCHGSTASAAARSCRTPMRRREAVDLGQLVACR